MNAPSSFNEMIAQACQLIICAQEGAANESLAKLYDEILNNTPSFLPENIQGITKLLPIILEAQQRRDMVYLADLLRYELLPILR